MERILLLRVPSLWTGPPATTEHFDLQTLHREVLETHRLKDRLSYTRTMLTVHSVTEGVKIPPDFFLFHMYSMIL
jgi:hypothetical protein